MSSSSTRSKSQRTPSQTKAKAKIQKKEPLIQLKAIKKTYGSGAAATQVLHGIDLTIYKGEMVAIMGASGSGKSTLMNILGTLDTPSSGEYFFDGKAIAHFKPKQLAELRNKQIGFVFQSFNLLPRLSIAKNIERPMLYGSIPTQERSPRITSVLEKVGLAHKRDARPLELSGGQQQRVAIARALVMQPPLILADEPTGALDSKTADMVMTELQKINRETGTTLIIITHDENITKYTSRTIIIHDGVITKQ